jgi:DNA-binding CsgD family transcriptional regulator
LLTDRELECVKLMTEHYYTKDGIADKLGISRRTVEKHFENISKKIGASRKDNKSVALQIFDKFKH